METILQMSSLPGLLLLVASGMARPDDIALRSTSCVARDLAVVTLIEALGEARSVKPVLLADATMRVLQARNACQNGKPAEALAIYDLITLDLKRSNEESSRMDP
jgi:hypothetical protein